MSHFVYSVFLISLVVQLNSRRAICDIQNIAFCRFLVLSWKDEFGNKLYLIMEHNVLLVGRCKYLIWNRIHEFGTPRLAVLANCVPRSCAGNIMIINVLSCLDLAFRFLPKAGIRNTCPWQAFWPLITSRYWTIMCKCLFYFAKRNERYGRGRKNAY